MSICISCQPSTKAQRGADAALVEGDLHGGLHSWWGTAATGIVESGKYTLYGD